MKKQLYFYFLFAWIGLVAAVSGQAQSSLGIMPGTVNIKVDEATFNALNSGTMYKSKNGIAITSIPAINTLNKSLRVYNWERIFPESPKYEARHRKHGLHLWYRVSFDEAISTNQAVTQFKELKGIAFVEPVYAKELIPYKTTPYSGSLKRTENVSFNDPMLPAQWHFNNTGQTGGTPGADIRLFDAWKTTFGTTNVIVSIHDQGVDVKHEDIANNLWINMAEKNGTAGVDDDNNGFIDDINGFNFRSNSGRIDAEEHGTHVAGTIAAVNNNGVGVCGVAGGSGNGDGARIMSCEILGGANTARSYIYAADNGAVISQNSWGYVREEVYEESVYDAIKYYIAEAGNYVGSPMKGGIVIFASGNNNDEGKYYPGAWPEVVAVSALDPFDKKTTYSNFDTWVDISAPGGENTYGFKSSVLSTVPGNKYAYMDGTSMACPHVSGVAALALSVNAGPNFTNEMLKQTLLTSFRNIEQLNLDYLGKLGAGAIDANLATKKNLGIAPDKITDLAIKGIAQDFATITWTAVGDLDDIMSENYWIYYNTEVITVENLANASVIKLNARKPAGTILEYEIQNLQPLTNYYFAVVASDRWNNKSQLSNQISAQTNEGPKLVFDQNDLSYIFNTNDATNATQNVLFNNDAAGVLRWTAVPRNVDFQVAWSKKAVNYPIAKANYNPVSNFKIGKLAVEPKLKNAVTYSFQSNFLNYFDQWAPIFMIGDQDTTVTNSSAQKFVITNEAGFNLTHVSMFLGHKNSTGPMILEIYKTDISNNNLVYLQEVNSEMEGYYDHFIKLDHQLYFEPGEEFWVVFHVPAGNVFPIGCSNEFSEEFSDWAKMSFNMGTTWIPLEQATEDNRFVWTTTAYSFNEYLGEYIKLEPNKGEILGNQNSIVKVTVDATKLINGVYDAKVVVKTNEAGNQLSKFNVKVDVSGKKPKLYSQQVINFNNVFVGASSTLKIQMRNIGYGNMKGLNAVIDNPEFEIANELPYMVSAQEDMWVYVKYTPKTVGNINAKLTITDEEGYSYTTILSAVAALPSKITLEPATQTFDNLAIGDEIKSSFVIKNTGNYPLQYFMPSQTDNSGLMEYNQRIHKFGYIGSKSYDANYVDINETGVRITEHFFDVRELFYPLEIGFNFPFYNTVKTKIFITPNGVLSFNNNSTFNVLPNELGDESSPSGLISATYMPYNLKSGGDIFYKKESDKLIVQYKVFDDWDLWNPIEFQIIIHDSGNIEYVYKSLGTLDAWSLSWYFAGIENEEKTDGLAMSEMFNNTFTSDVPWKYEFKYPGFNTIKTISNVKGTIAPGEQAEIEYVFNTQALSEGNHFNAIGIISNDPVEPLKQFIFNVNVNQGGIANFGFSTDVLNFGTVFQNDVKKMSFNAFNTGNKAIQIQSVTTSSNKIELSGPTSYLQKVGLQQNFDVNINTSELGAISEKLSFTDENGIIHELAVSANIIETPGIEINLTEVNETLASGDKNLNNELTVTNTGNHPLTYTIENFDWLKLQAKSLKSASNDTVSYKWKSNILEQITLTDPNYNWIDISKTGRRYWEELQNELELSIPIELPFEYDFYGKKYNKIWISSMGLIGVEYISSFHLIGQFFPDPEEANGIIAPAMGGMLGNSAPDDNRMAVYYQAFDDYVVIQYNNMKERFGASIKNDIQVLLYKTGEIKYQYRFGGTSIISEFTTVGIENQNGTDGCLVSGYQSYLLNKSAICFTPFTKRTLNPGETDSYSILIDASRLEKGIYTSSILINNDAPGKNKVSVPVNLEVTGVNEVSITGDFNFENKQAYQKPGFDGPEWISYTKDIEIKNTGHDVLTLSNFSIENGTELMLQKPIARRLTDDVDWYSLDEWDSFELMPSESKTIRVLLTPTGENDTISSKMIFEANSDQLTYEVPISASITRPGEMVIDTKEITATSLKLTDTESKEILLTNKGFSDLEYALSIEYIRTTETSKSFNSLTANNFANKLTKPLQVFAAENQTMGLNTATFNRTLNHDSAAAATSFLGFGAEVNFIGLTGFNAPDNGFNLSHVSTWYRWDGETKTKITVDILSGTTAENAVILHTQTFDIEREVSDKGELITLELSKQLQFLSNERFWVAFTYSLGVPYPQGTVQLEKSLPATFYYLGNEGWGDLSIGGPNYEKAAWMVRAHEAEFIESGWLTLSPSTSNIAPNGSAKVAVNLNAKGANRGLNKAFVIINSNDPVNPDKVVKIFYNINQAPAFASIPQSELTVRETDTLYFDVEVKDIENHNFDVKTNNLSSLSLIKIDSKYNVRYIPSFSDAGITPIVLTATDEYEAENTDTVFVKVTNFNRKPVANNPGQIAIEKADDYAIIKFSSIFTDPDGDEMAYTFGKPTNNTIVVAANTEDIILLLNNIGTTELYVKATDIYGDTADITLDIKIFTTGIESNIVQRSISIFPNPATENVSLAFVQTELGEVDIEVLDISGKMLISENYGRLPEGSQILQFTVSQLETGTYFVRLKNKGIVLSSQKIVVKK